jgi:hypothetical protein
MLKRSLLLSLGLIPSFGLIFGCSINDDPKITPNTAIISSSDQSARASAQQVQLTVGEVSSSEFLVDPAGSATMRTQSLPINCVSEINLRRSDSNWLVAFEGTRILLRRPSARVATTASPLGHIRSDNNSLRTPRVALENFGQNSANDERRLYSLLSCGSLNPAAEARIEMPRELNPRHTVLVSGNAQMAQHVQIPSPGEEYPAARDTRVNCVANEEDASKSGLNGIFLLPGSRILIVREWRDGEIGGSAPNHGRIEEREEPRLARTSLPEANLHQGLSSGSISAVAHLISCN